MNSRGRDDRRPTRVRSDGSFRQRPSDDRRAAPRRDRDEWAPSPDSVRKQMDRSKSRFDSPFIGTMFVAKQGDNTVRILKPTWANPGHYALEVWEHRYCGPDQAHYLCLRKMQNEPCPICDAERKTRERGDTEYANKLRPMKRWACYVLHRDNDDKNVRTKPLIWDMNGFQDEEIVGRTYEKKTNKAIPVTHSEHGYDLSFRRTGSRDRTRYVNFEFDRDPSPLHDDPRVIDQVLQFIDENPLDTCLRFFDAEYLENMMYGTAEPKDEDLDDEEFDAKKDATYGEEEEEEQQEGDDDETQEDDEEGEEETSSEEEDEEEQDESDEGDPEPDPDVSSRRPLKSGSSRRDPREDRERERPSRPPARQRPRQQSSKFRD